VSINAIGLSAGLARDFAEFESRYIGNGTFEYTLRTLEDPFIARVFFGGVFPYSFTNYLSSVAPPNWTNYFYQGVWSGISFVGPDPQPRLNEI
jgi:hypothetical protein